MFAFFLFILYTACSSFLFDNLKRYKKVNLITLLIVYLFVPFTSLGSANLFANNVNKSEQGKIIGGYEQISSLVAILSGLSISKLLSVSYSLWLGLYLGIALVLSYGVLLLYLRYSISSSLHLPHSTPQT